MTKTQPMKTLAKSAAAAKPAEPAAKKTPPKVDFSV
jgi:hypothetical protein